MRTKCTRHLLFLEKFITALFKFSSVNPSFWARVYLSVHPQKLCGLPPNRRGWRIELSILYSSAFIWQVALFCSFQSSASLGRYANLVVSSSRFLSLSWPSSSSKGKQPKQELGGFIFSGLGWRVGVTKSFFFCLFVCFFLSFALIWFLTHNANNMLVDKGLKFQH